jgi:hypothetical protein
MEALSKFYPRIVTIRIPEPHNEGIVLITVGSLFIFVNNRIDIKVIRHINCTQEIVKTGYYKNKLTSKTQSQ